MNTTNTFWSILQSTVPILSTLRTTRNISYLICLWVDFEYIIHFIGLLDRMLQITINHLYLLHRSRKKINL